MTAVPLQYSRPTVFKSLLLLLFFCCIAWWPVAFNIFSLKNDALNYFLPVRHLVSESVSNGYWPWWTPYLNLGYPLHGDMQSGVWNPVVQLFSLTGPYTLYKLQLETLLYVYLGGAGMFFLLKHFNVHPWINLLTSTAYMLCGFNTDSAQFLNWICGAAYLPFIFLFYYRTLSENNWRYAIITSFFLYLLFTGAYPADFIMTAYLVPAILIWHTVTQYKIHKNFAFAKKAAYNNILMAIVFLILSLPAILSYYPFLHLSERGRGASYNEAMTNPYHPVFLFSYLAPTAAWKINGFDITDPLERNSYFGLVTFVFLMVSFAVKLNHPLNRFFKWGFFLSLLFSFGEMGGIRIIAYYALPLMNSFRHPANAKLFTIFFGCVLSAIALQNAFESYEKTKPVIKRAFIAITFILAVLFTWGLTEEFEVFNSKKLLSVFNEDGGTTAVKLKVLLSSISFSDMLLFTILLQLPFLFWLYKSTIKKINLKHIALCGIINTIMFAMLAQPLTVVKKDKASFIQNIINKNSPAGYPIPDLTTPLSENSREGMKYYDEIGCLNLYNKKIGRVNYRITPSNLLTQNVFWRNENIRNTVLNYPLLYKADTAIMDLSYNQTDTSRKAVFTKNKITADIINNLTFDSGYTAEVLSFHPNEFSFNISTSNPSFFVLTQNHYPNWNLYIDGKPAAIEKVNLSFMGFYLKEGNHVVRFSYEAKSIKTAAVVSLLLLPFLIVIIFRRKKTSA